MIVALGSAFRNSLMKGHLPRYVEQVLMLRELLGRYGHTLYVVAAEGDSDDGTRDRLFNLNNAGIISMVVDVTHGQREFGSTEEPARFKALSGVANGILEAMPDAADVVIYVESDLVWSAQTMLQLMARLGPDVDVVSPLIFAGECFYDVFAYRAQGHRFGPFFPYHCVLGEEQSFSEVESMGSCLVMKGEVARMCRLTEEDVLVGFCREARHRGYRLWVDPSLSIRHL